MNLPSSLQISSTYAQKACINDIVESRLTNKQRHQGLWQCMWRASPFHYDMNDIVKLYLCEINLRTRKEEEGTDVDSQVLVPIYHCNETIEHECSVSSIGNRSSMLQTSVPIESAMTFSESYMQWFYSSLRARQSKTKSDDRQCLYVKEIACLNRQ